MKVLLEDKYTLTIVFESEYAKVYLVEGHKVLICEALKEYIPIENFKYVFLSMAPLVKEHQIEKFIFDKRNLRAFHQPSMEWYFIEWKKQMLEIGLSVHRKILPKKLAWFEQAVQAGRAKIQNDYPDNIIAKLDVQYRNSIEEAIES
ncbi:MAG: hypothetical protein ACPGJS_02145 [Flammeovirgaceae bacterium]